MNKALDYDHGNREYKIQIQASVSGELLMPVCIFLAADCLQKIKIEIGPRQTRRESNSLLHWRSLPARPAHNCPSCIGEESEKSAAKGVSRDLRCSGGGNKTSKTIKQLQPGFSPSQLCPPAFLTGSCTNSTTDSAN